MSSSPTRSPAPDRPGAFLRAVISLPVLAALLAGPPLLLRAVGQLPDGLPSTSDWWETGLEEALPSLLTVACWALWGYFVLCVVAEGALVVRQGAARLRTPRRPGPRGLAATLLGGILLLPAAQAATAGPAVAVPISDTAAPQGPDVEQQVATSRAAVGHPTHTVGAARETVWDISERYFGTGERVTDIRDLNTRLGAPLPDGVTLPPGTKVFLPHDAAPDAEPVAEEVGAEPEYTVPRAGLTLEDVAREQLGDADRASDLAALNPGIEADQEPSGALRPGAVLAMPANYAPPAPEAEPEEEAKPEHGAAEVTVEPGDTLWALSQEHRGDPAEWRGIYDDNREVIGEDPDLIRPGQELRIADSMQTEPAAPQPEEPAEQQPAPDGEQEAPTENGEESSTSREQDSGQAEDAPDERAESGGESTPAEASDLASDEQTEDEPSSTGVPSSVVALGAAGVLASGVLGMVARQRRLQQRHRRPGRRIPKPEGSAAVTEQALRYVTVGDQVAHLRRALQTAAMRLAEAGRELPALAAVTLTPRGATLHLPEPSPVIAPFVPADGETATAARRWHVAAGSKQVLAGEDLRNAEAPYPSLVSIGRTADGELVLVDLEHAGVLHLAGERRRQMLRTIAAELSCSELADDLELALVGVGLAPNLEHLGIAERITRYDGVRDAVPVLAAQHREQQDALTAIGVNHLRQARLNTELDGAWSPLVILADSAFTADASGDEAALNELVRMVDHDPRAAAAVVTSGTPIDAEAEQPPGVWVLSTDPGASVVVPGTDLTVVIEPLSDEDYTDLTEITTTSLSETDVPPAHAPAPAESTEFGEEQEKTGHPGPPSATGLNLLGGLASYTEEEDDDVAPGDTPTPETPAPAPARESEHQPKPPAPRSTATPHEVPDHAPTPAPSPPSTTWHSDAPMIRVLGTVDITGARGTITSARRRTVLEAAAWLALHPDADRRQFDEALWPGMPDVPKTTRNPRISQVRAWLGRDDDGEPYLLRGTYRYSPAVRCDWTLFQQIVAAAEQVEGPEADDLLSQALGLVRGRPFAGIDPRRYVWAEHLAQDMTSAIVDAAGDLAESRLERGAAREALWAATRGLEVAPEAEQLHRIAFRAHHALGDTEGLEHAARRLDVLLTQWAVDMQGETAILLRQLLGQGPAAAGRRAGRR